MSQAITAPAATPLTAEERAELRASLRGLLGRTADADAVSVQQRLVDLGATRFGAPDLGGGLSEVLVLAEELGRARAATPVLDASLLALFLRRAGGQAAERWVQELGSGEARPVLAVADPAVLQVTGDGVSGTLQPLPAAGAASHVVVADRDSILVADLAVPGAAVTGATSMGTVPVWRITLQGNAFQRIAVGATGIGDLAALARLAATGRALGAARRAFEIAVEHARTRHQFGRPIGSFQAVAHKLASCRISLRGLELTVAGAAEAYDRGESAWRTVAAAATAFAGATLRDVSMQTHHVLGAIGYSEEHAAPAFFRQVHLDVLAHGGPAAARRTLADSALSGGVPDDLGDAGGFRQEVRDWVAKHWSGARKAAHDRKPFAEREFEAGFARALGETGWIGLTWPPEHGGLGRGARDQFVLWEELERADAPRYGAPVQAAMLMAHGTAGQQARFLPPILRGELMCGMGYSEPDAGSDLASLRTTATRRGEGWVINGQKVWTTTYWGQYMLVAARTDPAANPPRAGLGVFLVPMDTPGITVHVSETMYGGTFANVFYDDVRVPGEALVGEPGDGWRVLNSALATERGLVGGGIVLKVARVFERFCACLPAHLAADPVVRDRLADLAARIQIGRRMMLHCATLATKGEIPADAAAETKVYAGELAERLGEEALDILGPDGALSQGAPGAVDDGRFEQQLRHSLMWVISIGTNEIQRSLIARHGLGLPR